ncbi:MAG: hypothetical protein RLY89_1573 [Bacteroidota bacterium]
MSALIPSEDYEQSQFVKWFRQTYPGIRIYSIPNGGSRHIAEATKLKATGASKGVPDLCVPSWRLYIEMKRTKGGKLSDEQADWIDYLQRVGYVVIVAYGALDAQNKIEKGDFYERKQD